MLPFKNYQYAPNENATERHRGLMTAQQVQDLNNVALPYDTYRGTMLVTDFDAITHSGFYQGLDATGAPTTGTQWYYLIHVQNTGDDHWAWQQACRLFGNELEVYQRRKVSTTWDQWSKTTRWDDSGEVALTGMYGAGYAAYPSWTPRVRRTADGTVRFLGLITKTTGPTVTGDFMITLPAGLRPISALIFPGASQPGYCELRVLSSGQVTVQTAGIPANQWVSLNGITYLAEG